MKPELKRPCPTCGGPMAWCGDVPTDDEPKGHSCHHLTCTRCEYNIDFHGKDTMEPEMDALLVLIAEKWNAAAIREQK